MRHLCRLVTPPGGRVLDPFAGSGSTAKAAVLEGFEFVGFELDETTLLGRKALRPRCRCAPGIPVGSNEEFEAAGRYTPEAY